jgi:hypothetical protein
MNARWLASVAAFGALALTPAMAGARGLGVEVWTDRGNDAVYQPGQTMEIESRVSDDAYLMVYEIDAEGYVRLLYPYRGSNGFVEGRQTYAVPPEHSNVDLVVQGTVGQCYVVAIAARDPFREMPWYLRPYDMQAEQVGYEGASEGAGNEEEGVTAEGRIVGDPFVAMERIRRRVLDDPEDAEAFATSYTTYYVHNEVRYPRYLCYDCHRPGHWAWWSGFDPYYTDCSVFTFRVNWGWGWGPGYWFGCVPYYNYVVRYDCPPSYRPYYQNRVCYSSWDGWRRWDSMWGNRLVRYKTDPPASYVPPSKYPDRGMGRGPRPTPPGFLVSDVRKGRDGMRPSLPLGRNQPAQMRDPDKRERTLIGRRDGDGGRRAEPMPREVRGDRDRDRGRGPGRGVEFRDRGGRVPWVDDAPRVERPRDQRPRGPALIDRPYIERRREEPRYERPRNDPPRERLPEVRAPREEKPRNDRPAEKPREQRSGDRGDRGRSFDAPRGGQRTKG